MNNLHKIVASLFAASTLVGCVHAKKDNLADWSNGKSGHIEASKEADLISASTPEGYYEIGRNYQNANKLELASIAFQKSLALNPDYVKSISGMAKVYASQHLYTLAIPLFEHVTKIEPNAINYNNLGYAYYLNKDYKNAQVALNTALSYDSGYTLALKNLELMSDKTIAEVPENVPSMPVATAESIQDVHPDLSSNNTESTVLIAKSEAVYELNIPKSEMKMPEVVPQSKPVDSTKFRVAMTGGMSFKSALALDQLFDDTRTLTQADYQHNLKNHVVVENGNGLKGAARMVAKRLEQVGIHNALAVDAKKFDVQDTHIQYRTGYFEDAMTLNQSLLNNPSVIKNDSLPVGTSIKLVVGRDLIKQRDVDAQANEVAHNS